MDRFTLDEDGARKWITRAISCYEDDEAPGPGEYLPEIPGDYRPQDFDNHGLTGEMVASARYAGVLTGPGEIEWDFVTDGEGESGYVWLLYVGQDDEHGHHNLKLATLYQDLRRVGDREAAPGGDAALAVLREAVEAGNGLLGDLDAYVAARRV